MDLQLLKNHYHVEFNKYMFLWLRSAMKLKTSKYKEKLVIL